MSDERRQRLEALAGWTWDILTAQWEEGFSKLLQFVKRERHARVPRQHLEDGFRLRGWVQAQRTRFVRGQLSDDRQRRLGALPGWVWDVRADQWEEGFGNLMQFVEREGQAGVVDDHVEAGFKLGVWVGTQRAAFRSGRLSDEPKRRLEALPGWTWDALSAQWEEGFSKLVQFVERGGHARVPQRHLEGGFKLGGWVQTQRTRFVSGRLSDERRQRLESLPGWVWGLRNERWEQGVSKLKEFAEREGHARVHVAHLEDGYKLGQWASVQRILFAAGRLSDERQRRLESLPGWVWRAAPG
jgi:hypothetical protein